MKPHDRAPDGWFRDGMILYGFPERGGLAVKGFWLEPPDVRGASFATLNTLQDRIRGLLALVTPGRRLQVQWSCDSDYRRELAAYRNATDLVTIPAVRAVREERFRRYAESLRRLQQEHGRGGEIDVATVLRPKGPTEVEVLAIEYEGVAG